MPTEDFKVKLGVLNKINKKIEQINPAFNSPRLAERDLEERERENYYFRVDKLAKTLAFIEEELASLSPEEYGPHAGDIDASLRHVARARAWAGEAETAERYLSLAAKFADPDLLSAREIDSTFHLCRAFLGLHKYHKATSYLGLLLAKGFSPREARDVAGVIALFGSYYLRKEKIKDALESGAYLKTISRWLAGPALEPGGFPLLLRESAESGPKAERALPPTLPPMEGGDALFRDAREGVAVERAGIFKESVALFLRKKKTSLLAEELAELDADCGSFLEANFYPRLLEEISQFFVASDPKAHDDEILGLIDFIVERSRLEDPDLVDAYYRGLAAFLEYYAKKGDYENSARIFDYIGIHDFGAKTFAARISGIVVVMSSIKGPNAFASAEYKKSFALFGEFLLAPETDGVAALKASGCGELINIFITRNRPDLMLSHFERYKDIFDADPDCQFVKAKVAKLIIDKYVADKIGPEFIFGVFDTLDFYEEAEGECFAFWSSLALKIYQKFCITPHGMAACERLFGRVQVLARTLEKYVVLASEMASWKKGAFESLVSHFPGAKPDGKARIGPGGKPRPSPPTRKRPL
ncbi:MAG: hypothetical protein LBO66_01500 [Deltaproteobacteria bacterium]|nr:hypothetical protein [Deltaproteobacteria bacterium]